MEMQIITGVAGGGSSITATQPRTQPKLGCYIYLLSAMAVIGGFLFGYDTGIVSVTMLYLPQNGGFKPMSSIWVEVIVAITPGMAGLGALAAGKLSDAYGRRKTIILSSLIFIAGALVCAVGISKWILLFGRILLGLAIGVASMIVPIYVGEASPAHIRGKLVTSFQLMITFGLVAANLCAAGFSYIDPVNVGWRLMFGFAALPALLQFIGFLFLPESPRWLYENVGSAESEAVLEKVYNGDKEWIRYELEEIHIAHRQQLKDMVQYGDGNLLQRILSTPHTRRALTVGCALQAFQQLSGINTLVYYTGTVIRSAGVRDNHDTIWIAAGTSAINFLCTFIPFYTVERLGRRVLLLGSCFGVMFSLCCLGEAFFLINKDSVATLRNAPLALLPDGGPASNEEASHCLRYSNCDYCVTDEGCGFCSSNHTESAGGYCYPKDPLNPSFNSMFGVCAGFDEDEYHTLENTTYEWADTYCHTRYTALPIIFMFIYLCCFAVGYGPLAWVLNAEFYPLWARSTCVSIATFFNWSLNLLVSLTFLTLGQMVTKFGAFFIYAGLTACALVYFYFYIPETKGQSLDEVQLLFMTKEEKKEMATSASQPKITSIDVGSGVK